MPITWQRFFLLLSRKICTELLLLLQRFEEQDQFFNHVDYIRQRGTENSIVVDIYITALNLKVLILDSWSMTSAQFAINLFSKIIKNR